MSALVILSCLWAVGDREIIRTHVLTQERIASELVYYGSPVLNDRVDALRLCEDVQDIAELEKGTLDEVMDADWRVVLN